MAHASFPFDSNAQRALLGKPAVAPGEKINYVISHDDGITWTTHHEDYNPARHIMALSRVEPFPRSSAMGQ